MRSQRSAGRPKTRGGKATGTRSTRVDNNRSCPIFVDFVYLSYQEDNPARERNAAVPGRDGAAALWPVFELRITTERLELTPVADGDLVELAALARQGIHDPSSTPFPNLWTDRSGPEFERTFAQYFWSQRARWSVVSWTLPFVVRWNGVPIGIQQVEADDFPTLRTVNTSSWVGLGYQGMDFGTEMRAAVLAFAFDALGAELALSGAVEYNAASIRVSEKLGYVRNGVRRQSIRGKPVEAVLFRLTRERWSGGRPVKVRIEGLEPCLDLFDVTDREATVPSIT